MKVTDIKLIDPKKITNATAVKLYEKLKKKTEGFDDDFLEVFDEEVLEFVNLIKTNLPQAFKSEAGTPKPPRTPKPRTPRTPTPTPPKEEGGDDLVAQVMEDYNLTRDKALRLIALRIEADDLKKENFEKLVDRLDKSEFYEGKNRISRSPIDKGRTRDLGKDSKQGALTSAEERKMTGTPFKRISKAGRKNQFGETTGGKVYYEYRQNRRDVDNRIKLATGGVLGQDVTYKYYDEERTGTIIDELPNGYEVSSKWGTILVSPKEVISINAPKKKRFSFFKDGGGVKGRFENNYQDKYEGDIWNNIWNYDQKFHFLSDHVNAIGFDEEFYNQRPKSTKKIQSSKGSEIGFRFIDSDKIINTKYVDLPLYVKHSLQNHIRMGQYKDGGGVGIPNADKMFHLPYEIAVYVPSTKDVDKNITATELTARVKEVEKYLAETFGGFTSSEKVGGYLSSKSSIVTEKVVPVTAFSSLNDFKANKSKLINKISVWAKKWGQEAIGFEFEGDLYYVPQKFKVGGTLKATYIPRRDIKLLTTVWGNNIKGKDLIDGAYTKRKDIKTAPKVARTMFEDETFEYKNGGLINKMKSIDREALLEKNKKIYDKLKKVTKGFDSKLSEPFYSEIFEFAKLTRLQHSYKPVKYHQLTDTESPIPIYTYLPKLRLEIFQEYLDKMNSKSLSSSEILEYIDSNMSMYIDGKKYYSVGISSSNRGMAVNLKNAYLIKKYLENIFYKVIIRQNNFRFDREKPEIPPYQFDYYDVLTDVKVPLDVYEDLLYLNIMSPNKYEYKKGGKLDATYIPRRDIKKIETVWGNNISGKDLIDGAYTKRTNIKTAPKVARTMFEDETFEYKKGGRLDLFEDYENIPSNVQKVLDKYAEKFGDDFSGMNYQDMKKMHDEIYKLGYTFDSGLDNQAIGLRPIGVNLNELVGYEDEENDK